MRAVGGGGGEEKKVIYAAGVAAEDCALSTTSAEKGADARLLFRIHDVPVRHARVVHARHLEVKTGGP